jgi:SAM-dependent methyltransferase
MWASTVLDSLARYVGYDRFTAACYKVAYWWTLRSGITAFDYGYAPYSELVANDRNAQEPYQMELYNQAVLLLGSQLSGTRILEISCGLGGGFAFIARNYDIGFNVVLDYALRAVKHARMNFGLNGVQGDARLLPFADCSFQAIINIEASHMYFGDSLLAELPRVLAPGGQVVVADWRFGAIEDIETALRANFERFGFRLVRFRDITQNVIAACEADTPRREAFLNKLPWPIRELARRGLGTIGGEHHRAFITHRAGYFLLVASRECSHPKA